MQSKLIQIVFLQKIDHEYSSKAHRFVKVHAEEDPDHIEKAFELIGKLSDERKELIRVNMIQTADAYVNMLKSCAVH